MSLSIAGSFANSGAPAEPTGAASGDTIVAIVSKSSAFPAPPAGWTTVLQSHQTGAWYTVATILRGASAPSYSFGSSISFSHLLAIRGGSVAVIADASSGSGTSLNTPTIAGNPPIWMLGSDTDSGSWNATPPTGFTNVSGSQFPSQLASYDTSAPSSPFTITYGGATTGSSCVLVSIGPGSTVVTKDATASATISRIPVANVTGAGRFSIPHSKDASASARLGLIHNKDVPASSTFTRTDTKDVATSAALSRAVTKDVSGGAVLALGGESAMAASAIISAYGPLIPTIAIARISGRPTPAIARMKRPGG